MSSTREAKTYQSRHHCLNCGSYTYYASSRKCVSCTKAMHKRRREAGKTKGSTYYENRKVRKPEKGVDYTLVEEDGKLIAIPAWD